MIYDGIMTDHPSLDIPRAKMLHPNVLWDSDEDRKTTPNLQKMIERAAPTIGGTSDAFYCNLEHAFHDDPWIENPADPDSFEAMAARVFRGQIAVALQAITPKPVWVYGGIAGLGVNALKGGIDKVLPTWESIINRAYIQHIGSWVVNGYYRQRGIEIWFGNLYAQVTHARDVHGVETVVFVSPYAAGKTELQDRSLWVDQLKIAHTLADHLVIWTGEKDVSWDECGEHVEAALTAVGHEVPELEAA